MKKWSTLELFNCKAKYLALKEATKEAVFLQRFLKELGFKELITVTLINNLCFGKISICHAAAKEMANFFTKGQNAFTTCYQKTKNDICDVYRKNNKAKRTAEKQFV